MSRLSTATLTAMRNQQSRHAALWAALRSNTTITEGRRQTAIRYLDNAVEDFQISILCRGRAIRNRAIEAANCALDLAEAVIAE